MTELAPGFYVDEWVPCGGVYRLQAGLFFGHAGPVVAIHPVDWERIPGERRERILDELVKADADRGLRRLEAMLREELAMSEDERPPTEYGEWTRGNAGQVGRTVTTWHRSIIGPGWTPVVDWEPHPDERTDEAER